MSYQSVEESVEGGTPIFLYHFVQYAVNYHYTSHTEEITDELGTWTPATIIPGKFESGADVGKNVLSLRMPINNPVAQSMLGFSPDVTTHLTVFRRFLEDAERLTYWKGRVSSVEIDGNLMELACDPIASALRRPGLRSVISKTCIRNLYGPGCWVNPETYALTSTISAVDGSLLTVGGLLNQAITAPLTGGIVKAPDGSVRMIAAHYGVNIRIMRPLKNLVDNMLAHPTGFTATFYPGCGRTVEQCRDKFGNLGNFFAFPWKPSKNPFKNPFM